MAHRGTGSEGPGGRLPAAWAPCSVGHRRSPLPRDAPRAVTHKRWSRACYAPGGVGVPGDDVGMAAAAERQEILALLRALPATGRAASDEELLDAAEAWE